MPLHRSYVIPLLFLWLFSQCNHKPSGKPSEISGDSLSRENTSQADSVVRKSDTTILVHDPFRDLLTTVNDSLQSWGFRDEAGIKRVKKEDFDRHWYLKNYFRHSIHAIDTLPPLHIFEQIGIRQVAFRKQWKLILEEWEFESRDQAESMLYLINRNYRMDDFKPPREKWLAGNRIYFIVATAARDWFDYGPQLVKLATNRNPWLLRLLFDPINMVEFKKEKGGSNSAPYTSKNLFQPDTAGFHYYYTLFNTPVELPESVRFRGLNLYTFKYGTDAGDYFDENEIMVGLDVAYEDRDLEELNLVGKSMDEWVANYGAPQFSYDNLAVFYYQERILILETDGDRIEKLTFWVYPERLDNESVKEALSYYR